MRSVLPSSHGETGRQPAPANACRGSFPTVCSGGEYQIVQGLEINDYAQAKIDATGAELAAERDMVRDAGLI